MKTSVYFLPRSVTLRLSNEPACSGEDLTFTCERTVGSERLEWILQTLPGVGTLNGIFGQALSTSFDRITSSDNSPGPNPSIITIRNATAADNGATVQCRILTMEVSNVITLSIRK